MLPIKDWAMCCLVNKALHKVTRSPTSQSLVAKVHRRSPPMDWRKWPRVQSLTLCRATVPEENLSVLTNLIDVELWSGTSLANISHSTNLRRLSLMGCRSGVVQFHSADWFPSLETLKVRGGVSAARDVTQFIEHHPDLRSLETMEDLHALPSLLGKLPQLHTLVLHNIHSDRREPPRRYRTTAERPALDLGALPESLVVLRLYRFGSDCGVGRTLPVDRLPRLAVLELPALPTTELRGLGRLCRQGALRSLTIELLKDHHRPQLELIAKWKKLRTLRVRGTEHGKPVKSAIVENLLHLAKFDANLNGWTLSPLQFVWCYKRCFPAVIFRAYQRYARPLVRALGRNKSLIYLIEEYVCRMKIGHHNPTCCWSDSKRRWTKGMKVLERVHASMDHRSLDEWAMTYNWVVALEQGRSMFWSAAESSYISKMLRQGTE